MRWSWKITEIAGIGIHVHATFLLIIGWVALTHWIQSRTLAGVVGGVLFILALFGCVVLHELGHALTARKYGIRTRDITLLPIGGVARLERMPDEPRQELWVALAGPAVSVLLAAIFAAWLIATRGPASLGEIRLTGGSFLAQLMVVNVFLAIFNMLPAFPMDGGRVLRAILATGMDFTRATQIAAGLGQGIAFLLGFLGLFTNPFLLFIALFVWIGAAQESSMAQMRSALGGIPVSRAMLTDYQTVAPHEDLGRVVELILSGSQQDFPVVERGRVVGVLQRADVLVALAKQGSSARVGDVMRRDFEVVEPGEMLETALRRLEACSCRTLPVTRGGELVGLVTMDNVGEFIMIQAALSAARKAS